MLTSLLLYFINSRSHLKLKNGANKCYLLIKKLKMFSFHITNVEAKLWNPVVFLQSCKLNEYFLSF